jgi:hypothetical protein
MIVAGNAASNVSSINLWAVSERTSSNEQVESVPRSQVNMKDSCVTVVNGV